MNENGEDNWLRVSYSYRPRPGLVLDDPEYKPAGGSRPLGMGLGLGLGLGLGAPPPIVTAPAGRPGEVFDVTVSAVQGPDGGGGGGGPALHTGRPFVYPVMRISLCLPLDSPQRSGQVTSFPRQGIRAQTRSIHLKFAVDRAVFCQVF
ncbi:Uncharacterized protein GBIM_20810 [Gryllus bimaculatus]|nr:Uncharacterized protein GBIM_20810 [Gryllus bimaculatus]